MIIDNIFKYLEYKGISVYEFSKNIELSSGYLSKTRTNKGNVGGHILEKIINYYPDLNPEWLLTGNENMIRDIKENNYMESETSISYSKENIKEIPLLDYDIKKNMSNKYNVKRKPNYFNVTDFFNETTAAMKVYDNSMIPNYKKNSIILLKEILDKKNIIFGDEYVIETSKYRIIKRLEESNDNSFISCYSLNNECHIHNNELIYKPFDIAINKIICIYSVLGSIID